MPRVSISIPLVVSGICVSCNSGHLIDAGSDGVRYQLVAVQDRPLPAAFEIEATYGSLGYWWVLEGELVLWPDSTAAELYVVRDSTFARDTTITEGTRLSYYTIRGDSLYICAQPPPADPWFCDGGRVEGDDILLRLYGGRFGVGRFTRQGGA